MTGAVRILVTGATGFVGRNILAPLSRLGFEVHAVGRQALNAQAFNSQAKWHACDLLDASARRGLLEAVRPSHLLHLAWYAEHGKFWASPLNLEWLQASNDLVRVFAAVGGRRFVGLGTCAEYSWNRDIYDEEKSPLKPASLYGAAKASAFLTGSAFAASVGVEFAWGRIFYVFGPDEPPARIVPSLIRAHLRGSSLDCGLGTQPRDFIPVAALGEAIAALAAGQVTGPVNLGSGQTQNLRDLSARIARIAGRTGDIRFGALEDKGPGSLVPDLGRLHHEVGWRPHLDFDASLGEAIAFWKAREP